MPVLYICNVKHPSQHCRVTCLHGKAPHPVDDCTQPEYCDITREDVCCRKVGKRELKKYQEMQQQMGT